MDSEESVNEAFAIIERSSKSEEKKQVKRANQLSKEPEKKKKVPSSRRWKPLVCEGEVCSWLISRQKLQPSPVDESYQQTKKLYRNIYGGGLGGHD